MKTLNYALIIATMLTMSCSKTPSDNVKTAGFYVTYNVTGNNQNAVTCTARLQVGGSTGTYLDLNAGDSITCDGQTMARSEFAGIITYSANAPYVPGKTYEIVLSRSGEGSYSSTAVLPDAIAGYSPNGTPSFQKGSTINPTWTASNNGSDYLYVGLSYSTALSGSHFISKTDSAPENGNGVSFGPTETQLTPPEAGTWNGTIRFTRAREGTLSGSLAGSIRASQEVTVNISLID